ncbi:alpha/beta fold hydrolase [Larkinella insperata]|uniref:Alpha/beta fold hydrolase n=1 Tax=Larkinella insperata TaxID=332158 RepID=A0ABW3QFA5_9BACT|nr:alpha/beta hydrolase [Larkinella insperata]
MSDKPVIVLIHGHGVNASIWDGVYDNLSADFSIVKPDFSAHTGHESIDAYAEEVFSQLQTSQIQSSVLIGHSMGGYIALAFAEQHPEMVKGLVLINSTAFADDEAKKQSRQKAIETMEQNGAGAFIEQTVPKMFGESYTQSQSEGVKKQVEVFSALPAEALIAGVKAMASRQDRTHVLKEASFPVLLIAGQEDQIIPFAKSQELFEAAPQARTVVLEKAGHLGMIESPDEVIQAIREFVGTL